MSGLLSWIGLSPALSTAPAVPVESPMLWAALAWARRQFTQALGTETSVLMAGPTLTSLAINDAVTAQAEEENSPPVVSDPTLTELDPVTGAVTGMVNATDPDGDELSYSVTEGPSDGTVVLDETTGAFVYTPTEATRLQAGLQPGAPIDFFAVAVSDGQAVTAQFVTVPRLATELEVGSPIAVGRDPAGVAVSPDGTRVYVADEYDKTVTVIDTATGTVVATIPMGGGVSGLALAPDGSTAYATLRGTQRVAVIDTATNTVLTTIKVGSLPSGVAVAPDGSRVYVANSNGSTVSVIGTATNTEIGRIVVGGAPSGVALSPDGTRVYVTSRWNDNIAVIDTATDTVITTIAVGDSPRAVAISPDGTRAYVTNFDGTLSVIDTAINHEITRITVGPQPLSVALSPDGSLAYVVNSDDTVSVIDTTVGNAVIVTVAADPDPENGTHYVAVSPDGSHIYITDAKDRTLRVLTLTPVNQLPAVGDPAFSIEDTDPDTGVVTGTVNVTDPDGNTLTYSLSQGPDAAVGTVTVDEATGDWTFTPTLNARLKATDVNATSADQQVSFTITASDGKASVPVSVAAAVAPVVITNIAIDNQPRFVAVSPDGTRAYVANVNGDLGVKVIDTATNTVIATIDPNQAIGGLALSPGGDRLYLVGVSRLVVIDTETNMLTGEIIPVAPGANDVAVSQVGNRAYVIDGLDNTVTVIDTESDTAIGEPIPVGESPFAMAVSPNGSRVYVTSIDDGTVTVIDALNNTVIGEPIQVGESAWGVAVSPDSSLAYVAVDGQLKVLDAATHQVTDTIPIPGAFAVAVSPDGSLLYVTSFGGGMTVIDTATKEVIATLPIEGNGGDIAVSSDGSRVYVANDAEGTVSVVTVLPAAAAMV